MKFGKLGLVVIDEQHKFGVAQRGILKQKGIYPDTLVMTATPIPRTLAMTAYGDLDVSVISDMPPGRVPVKTSFVPMEKRDKMYGFIKKQIKDGRQVYIVYPLVEESEKLDLKAAKESFIIFKEGIFKDLPIALLHGKMKGKDKNRTMQDFQQRKTSIIVATTVIEVGLDVPNANIMVIEHVERFGLSQLHQLRGRIGRGAHKSYCFLLSDTRLSQEAEARVKALCATNDGFKIAEVDMAIRGPGEIMGTRQHGLPELRVARLTDAEVLTNARQSAFEIIAGDDKLIGHSNRLLRRVLIERYGDKIKYSKIA
jgi:ATP-dependent DNA helicase RecG